MIILHCWWRMVQGAAYVQNSASPAKNPLLGDIMIVAAQVLAATQFIVEEKFLAKCAPKLALK